MRLFLVSYRFLKPNEVILKKIIFWLALIVGIVALIGSCAKKDDTTTTTTLSAPTGLTATGGASQVVLDWTAVSGASSYTVYWDNATGVSSSSTAITSVSTDSYSHTGLDNGTTYYYKVAAVDSAGTAGTLSSEVNATTYKYLSSTTTASGSITVGSETMSGVYATECYTSALSTLISAGRVPSDTASYGFMTVVTGSDNISEESQFFTDSSCTTNSLLMKTQYDNVTVGSASGSNYPLTLTKARSLITAGTTDGKTMIEAMYGGFITVTVGTEYTDTYAGSTNPRYNLINLSSTTLYMADESSSETPSSVGDTAMTKQ